MHKNAVKTYPAHKNQLFLLMHTNCNGFCFTSQPQFIASCMAEIKKELKQENVMVKANAVSKLTYVSGVYQLEQSLGPKFSHHTMEAHYPLISAYTSNYGT